MSDVVQSPPHLTSSPVRHSSPNSDERPPKTQEGGEKTRGEDEGIPLTMESAAGIHVFPRHDLSIFLWGSLKVRLCDLLDISTESLYVCATSGPGAILVSMRASKREQLDDTPRKAVIRLSVRGHSRPTVRSPTAVWFRKL